MAKLAGAVEYTDCFSTKWQHHSNECPRYDTKQSDGEALGILELWRMQSAPLLPSLPGPLEPEVVAHDTVLSVGEIELNCVLMLNRSA